MLRYEDEAGRLIEADSYEGVVHAMRGTAWVQEGSDREYMLAVASRVGRMYGEPRVRTDSAAHFVEDLVLMGILKPVED